MVKRIMVYVLILLGVANQVIAQAPPGISFQSLIKDNQGNLAKNTDAYVKCQILKGNISTGTLVYEEVHTVRTNGDGIFSIIIGQGTKIGGPVNSLYAIDWGHDTYFLNLKTVVPPNTGVKWFDPTLNYTDIGTTQFWSVPFALYALSSGTSPLDTAAMLAGVMKYRDTAQALSGYARKGQVVRYADTAYLLANRLKISDTTAMLDGYARRGQVVHYSDTTQMVGNLLRISDTATMLKERVKYSDTAYLVANRLKISDTTTMLDGYARIGQVVHYSDTTQLVGNLLRISDTATMMKDRVKYSDTAYLVANRLKISDTTTMLDGYARRGQVVHYRDTAQLVGNLLRISDTATMMKDRVKYSDTAYLVANRLKLSDTTTMLDGYARNGQVVQYSDTAQLVGNLLRISDTATMMKDRVKYSDTAYLVSNRLKISDTTTMLDGYSRKGQVVHYSDTAQLVGNLLRISDTATMLQDRVKYSDTAYLVSNRLKISDTTTMLDGYARRGQVVHYSDTAQLVGNLLRISDTATMLKDRVKYSDTAYLVANRLKNSDTTTMLDGYARRGQVVHYSDTAQIVGNLLRISDTATMLKDRVKYSDTAYLVANRLKISDTTTMLDGYARRGQVVHYSDTAQLVSNLLRISDTTTMLDGYARKGNVTWSSILNKPLFATVATTGSYNDLLNKPVNVSAFSNDAGYITAAAVTWSNIIGKPSFATVATSGNYNDLSNRPSVPTHLSQLINDYGYNRFYDGWQNYDANSILGSKSGFSYANNAPFSGPLVHFDAGGYGLQLSAAYSGGNSISFRTRNGDIPAWNSWRELIHTGNIGSQSVNYANSAGSAGSVSWGNVSGRPTNLSQFTNDLGNYGNWHPLEDQRVGSAYSPSFANIYTSGWYRNYGATGLYNQSYGNHFYADNSSYWNIAGSGGSSGGLVLRDNYGGPIKGYYYWDVNGTGLLNNTGNWSIRANYGGANAGGQLYGTWTGTISDATNATYGRYVYNNGAYSGSGWVEASDLGVRYANSAGSATNATNATYGRYVYDNGSYSGSAAWREASSMYVYYSYLGRLVYNNGAYSGSGWIEPSDLGVRYANSAGTASNSNALGGYGPTEYLGKEGNSYYQQRTWIAVQGDFGMYFPGASGFGSTPHFYPNNSSYGTFRMDGYRNGYTGIYWGYSGVTSGMYDGGGNGGAYDASIGWHYYYHRGNSCLGVNGSGTSASYAMYVNGKGIYASGSSAIAGNLDVSGDMIGFSSVPSDIRLKKNLVRITGAIDKVKRLNGYFFQWKKTGVKDLGLKAQEVELVLPEIVKEVKLPFVADDDKKYKVVQYEKVVALLIEAQKEQDEKVEAIRREQDRRIEALLKEVIELRKEVKNLKSKQ